MKLKTISILLTTLTIFIWFLAPCVFADDSAETMEFIREEIHANKKRFVAMNMLFTKTQSEKFWPLYDQYQKELEALGRRYGSLLDTYVREYFNIPLLYDEPQKLEYVISVLKKFYLASINKSEVKEGIKKIPFYGKLWKIGLSQFPNLAVNKNDYKIIPVYILGDAKPENILTRGKYLSYDNESFCIGDISSDLELIVEHYQFFKKEKLLKKTLELSQRVFSDIDNKIVEKTLLGLIAMKKMELDTCSGDICRRERNWLLNDAINLFKKYRN